MVHSPTAASPHCAATFGPFLRTRLPDIHPEADLALPEVGREGGIEPGVEVAVEVGRFPAGRLVIARGARLEACEVLRGGPLGAVPPDGDRLPFGQDEHVG